MDATSQGLPASPVSRAQSGGLRFCAFKGLPLFLGFLCGASAIAAEVATDPAPISSALHLAEEYWRHEPAQEGVPVLQMSTDYGSPVLALGGYRPIGQLESSSVRVGPFAVRAAVHSGMGYNDNVTLSAGNRVSSMFFTLSPSVSVGLEGAAQRYYAVYRGNSGAYSASAGDDYAEHNFALSALNEWTTRLRSQLRYEFVRGHDPRGSTGAAVTESNVWNVNAVRGNLAYGAAGAVGGLEASAGYAKREYVTSRALTATQDYDRFDVSGAFYWRVAPKTRALAEIRRSDISYDLAPIRDSVETRYLIGALWDATAKTSGSLRLGHMTREPDSSSVPDFSGFTYEASVVWSPLSYSVITLVAVRTINEGAEVGNRFVVDNLASVGWVHTWSDRARTGATYAYAQQEHDGLGRTDTYHALGLRGSYAVARHVHIGAELRHDRRSSPATLFEYRRNLTLLTLEAAL